MHADVLHDAPLFRGLPQSDLEHLSSLLRRRRYARGESIFLEGDAGLNLCIIESGHVKLSRTSDAGREISFAYLHDGETFGELALLDGEPRSADAVATEPTQLLLLGRDDFVRFLHERPSVAVALLGDMSKRLR